MEPHLPHQLDLQADYYLKGEVLTIYSVQVELTVALDFQLSLKSGHALQKNRILESNKNKIKKIVNAKYIFQTIFRTKLNFLPWYKYFYWVALNLENPARQ